MDSKLFTIYGARLNKDATRVNVAIVTGSDVTKEFANISIKLDNSQKTKVEIKDDVAIIKVPLLHGDKK